METRFGIQRHSDRLWWSYSGRWSSSPIAAMWFDSETEATCRALRELDDLHWSAVPIPLTTPVQKAVDW